MKTEAFKTACKHDILIIRYNICVYYFFKNTTLKYLFFFFTYRQMDLLKESQYAFFITFYLKFYSYYYILHILYVYFFSFIVCRIYVIYNYVRNSPIFIFLFSLISFYFSFKAEYLLSNTDTEIY